MHKRNSPVLHKSIRQPRPSLRFHFDRDPGITNKYLSNAERAIVQSLLQATEQDLKQADHDIVKTMHVVEALKKRRLDLFRKVERLRCALVPGDAISTLLSGLLLHIGDPPRGTIQSRLPLKALGSSERKLTPGLLGKIFIYSLEGKPLRFPAEWKQPPWIFLCVCRRWRTAAMHEPRLWTHAAAIHSPGNYMYAAAFLQNYFSKLPGFIGHLSPILEELSIEFPYGSLPISPFHPRSLTTLHTLSLLFHDNYGILGSSPTERYLPPVPLPSFEDISHLRHVVLGGREFTMKPARLPPASGLRLPWAQITKLVVERAAFPSSDFFRILRQCSSLVECLCDGLYDQEGSESHARAEFLRLGRCTLPALKSLSLTFHKCAISDDLMDHLILPSLQSFVLRGNGDLAALPHVPPLIDRASRSLSQLEVRVPLLESQALMLLDGLHFPALAAVAFYSTSRSALLDALDGKLPEPAGINVDTEWAGPRSIVCNAYLCRPPATREEIKRAWLLERRYDESGIMLSVIV